MKMALGRWLAVTALAGLMSSGAAAVLAAPPASAVPTSPFADVGVYFESAPPSVVLGGTIDYNMCVHNYGPGYAAGVWVVLSAANQFRSWIATGTSSGDTYCWSADIFAGHPGFVPAIAAVVTFGSIDLNPFNNVAVADTFVYRPWGFFPI